MDRLHRIRLLLGDKNIAKLNRATVMVVGCGAVGSFAIEALARSGIGHIIVVDSDVIEPTNINRQLFALESTVGMPKVDVATARIHDINPDIKTTAINMFVDENALPQIIPDLVIDAIDSVQSKIALYKWCANNNIPFISSMGAARKTDPTQVRIARISKTKVCPLAAKIRKLIREHDLPDFNVVYSTEVAAPQLNGGREFGSIITVTGTFGLVLADYAIKQILQ